MITLCMYVLPMNQDTMVLLLLSLNCITGKEMGGKADHNDVDKDKYEGNDDEDDEEDEGDTGGPGALTKDDPNHPGAEEPPIEEESQVHVDTIVLFLDKVLVDYQDFNK